MKRMLIGREFALVSLAAVLVAGVLALAGCSCSNQSSQSSSAGAETYTVPNVVSMTQSDASKAILAVGLQVGTVTKEASDTVPSGSVISQDPKPLTAAAPGSAVNLVVSSGKTELKDVTVPDLKGKSQSDAEKALKDVGLIGVASNPEETDEVQPGQVFKQSVAAGTTVKEGTQVAFTVALAVGEVEVPDVTGKSQDDAKKAITDAKLGFDVTNSYSDSVAEGNVISQSVAAGTKVKQGTTVTINVSLGAKPVEDVAVPDLMTYSWSEAKATLESAGLSARYTGDPAGVVVAQDVAAGTKVAPGTLVTVTLKSQIKYVEVPDLIGKSVSAAESATDKLKLALHVSGGNDGIVVDQSPAAGTQVEEHSTVSVTVKSHDEVVTERFLGTWQADRASLDIEYGGGGVIATISWAQSADETYSWEYFLEVKGNKMVCNKSGNKYVTKGGGDPELIYSDGSAEFSLQTNGQLIWNDKKENAGKDLKFGRV